MIPNLKVPALSAVSVTVRVPPGLVSRARIIPIGMIQTGRKKVVTRSSRSG